MIARDAKKMTKARKKAADRLYEMRVQKILKDCHKAIKKAAKKSEDYTTVRVYDTRFVAWSHCNEVVRRLKEEGYDTYVKYPNPPYSESNEIHIIWRVYE